MSDHSERIRLLTLCPPNWSRRDISRIFSVSEWEGRMTIELYESSGILAVWENNEDRGQISPSTIQTVLAYYQGRSTIMGINILIKSCTCHVSR